MFVKGVAVTGFPFSLINTSGNAVSTGTVTGYYTAEGGDQTALAGSPVHEGNGQWSVDLTAAEMDYDTIGLIFTHPSAIPASFTIATYTATEAIVATSGTFLGDQMGPTAFTSGDVLTRVRKITNRHVDTIEDELYEVLLDVSNRGFHLKSYSSDTNSSGEIQCPSNMVNLMAVMWDSGRIGPIDWDTYMDNKTVGYVKKGNRLFISPAPSTAIAYTLYYECYHPNDLNTIMYGMPFFMCVVYGVVAKCFENLGPEFDPAADKYLMKYERELAMLTEAIDNGPPPISRLRPLNTIEDY
ncbi:MAG: hypothetical protein DRP56_07050 [Planctomycetota bacterium]|nr:MAG: hypothetical protein DRP56_07050 [Planctomycetota bacterium]